MQPMQPLETDDQGVVRFKGNALVQYILDHGGIDMNDLAVQAHLHGWPVEDQEQFAMLIGYSLSGFGDLSYVRDDTYEAATQAAAQTDGEKAAMLMMTDEAYLEAIDAEAVRRGYMPAGHSLVAATGPDCWLDAWRDDPTLTPEEQVAEEMLCAAECGEA